MTVWLRDEDGGKTAFIPEEVITGICAVLVNGRDIEDALAPIYVVEEIIQAYVGQHDWQTPPLPEWIGPNEDDPSWTGEERKKFMDEFQLTPIVLALATLDYLGGGYTTEVTLQEQEA
jgi:hypothetical protein